MDGPDFTQYILIIIFENNTYMNLKIKLMVCSSCIELVSFEIFLKVTFHIESTLTIMETLTFTTKLYAFMQCHVIYIYQWV